VLFECDLDVPCSCAGSAQLFTCCHASEGGLDGDSRGCQPGASCALQERQTDFGSCGGMILHLDKHNFAAVAACCYAWRKAGQYNADIVHMLMSSIRMVMALDCAVSYEVSSWLTSTRQVCATLTDKQSKISKETSQYVSCKSAIT